LQQGAFNQTPWQKWELFRAKTPTLQQVRDSYDPTQERIRSRDYLLDIGKPRKVICLQVNLLPQGSTDLSS
jgi:hypothetical protein